MRDFGITFIILLAGFLVLYFIFGPLLAIMEIPKRLDDIEAAIKEATEMLNRRNNE